MNLGKCEWGCADRAVRWRYDPLAGLMLPVCDRHRGDYALIA